MGLGKVRGEGRRTGQRRGGVYKEQRSRGGGSSHTTNSERHLCKVVFVPHFYHSDPFIVVFLSSFESKTITLI